MRWQKGALILLLGLRVLLSSQLAAALNDQQAWEIIDEVDQLLRGQSSSGTVQMQISTVHWQRDLSLHIWSLGTEHVLIRITNPQKEAGTATLKIADDIWNYLPKVNRTIKIPTSLMMDSWMGSHFTNDDLVKESRLVRDYGITTSFEGNRAGVEVYEYILTPKPEAAVVWGKIVIEVRQADHMPTWERYYDEEGKLVRELTFSDYKTMGGRLIPTRLLMRPADKADEQTVIIYEDIIFDAAISQDTFSLRNLGR
ncbi:MAG: outer membrane lipoprotein-sorting protein [Deltaproteobacteria bacterium]|nr:outer membrane lipoprotein-sorting protein [Deltaproteobacteria bacterium]